MEEIITLTSNEFFKNEFYPAHALFISHATPETLAMSEARYKAEILDMVVLFDKYKPKRVIGNQVDMQFSITPEIQDWLNETMISWYVKNGLEKLALVTSKDLFTAVSVEQTMEEAPETPFAFQYFDDINKAIAWCAS